MKTIEKWKKEDYYTYFLIYVANANFEIVSEEIDYILERVSKEKYKDILKIFKRHNDLEKMEVFEYYLYTFCQTSDERKNIFKEMKELFNVDGRFDSSERMFFLHFRRKILGLRKVQVESVF